MPLVGLLILGCTSLKGEAGVNQADGEEPVQEPPSPDSSLAASVAPGREATPAEDDDVPLPEDSPPGELRTYEGRFDIDRLSQSKRFQGSWLVTEGGISYVLGYRPMPEYFAFVDRRVVLEGRPYSPGGQRIGAEHLEVSSMRLADGEAELAGEPPSSLPVPPRVETGEELGARGGRWVEVFATLIGEREGAADGDWRTLEFRMDDGTIVVTVEASWVVDKTFRGHFGQRMTLLGKVYERDGDLGLGPVEACTGELVGCGMTAKGLRR